MDGFPPSDSLDDQTVERSGQGMGCEIHLSNLQLDTPYSSIRVLAVTDQRPEPSAWRDLIILSLRRNICPRILSSSPNLLTAVLLDIYSRLKNHLLPISNNSLQALSGSLYPGTTLRLLKYFCKTFMFITNCLPVRWKGNLNVSSKRKF